MVSTLLEVYSKQLTTFEEVAARLLESQNMLERTQGWDDLILVAQDFPAHLRRMFDAVTGKLWELRWPYDLANEYRDQLVRVFDLFESAVRRLAEQVASEKSGAHVRNATLLTRVVQEVEGVRREAFRGWSPYTLEDSQQTLEQARAGAFGSLE